MKLQMKLKTRLFFGFSALITVALIGLGLALIGVVQIAKSQEQLAQQSFDIFKVNQLLRQQLGNHLVLVLQDGVKPKALEESRTRFDQQLADAISKTSDPEYLDSFAAVDAQFRQLIEDAEPWLAGLRTQANREALRRDFALARGLLVTMQDRALERIQEAESRSRERSLATAGILGLTSAVVLLIGFFTAHGFVRRFSDPIEELSSAADRIGKGDFDIVLPHSPIAEVSSLIRRFGLMAQALHQFQQTNVEALVHGQQRLQALLDSIDDGLLILDRQGRLEHANPVAQRQLAWQNSYLGASLGEALGYPELDEATEQVLRDRPLAQPPRDLEIQADGEKRLLSWRLSPISHQDGRINGAVMVLHDVTDQRNFERVRNEFVLRASHELRTPVTGIQMAFSLLRERVKFPPDSRESDLLDTVHDEMQRLVRLINDLLDFSRYQSGQQKLDLAPCDIQQMLCRLRQRFAPQASARQIALELEIQDELPKLLIDQTQMERVLDNLLTNALRHTGSGGRVHLLARRHGDRVILSVEDNGEGIPYSQQARIFEPFVQIGRHHGGAGLGLALCKEIAQLHGGRIGVHSRIGHGTIFYLALPI